MLTSDLIVTEVEVCWKVINFLKSKLEILANGKFIIFAFFVFILFSIAFFRIRFIKVDLPEPETPVMQVIIFRHGIAEVQGPDGSDYGRRLTDEGVEKLEYLEKLLD